MTWFDGLPLMELLDTIEIGDNTNLDNFRLPVQYVNRPHLDFRGFCGTIAAGTVAVGDDITVLPSMKTSRVKEVIQPAVAEESMRVDSAFAPMAVTITLEDEIDVSRGDMIVKSSDVPEVSDSLEVMLVWMSESQMVPGTDYLIKRATNVTTGRFNAIDFQVDVNTMDQAEAAKLQLNEIAQCQLHLKQSISFDAYDDIKGTGAFIVIDKYTNATLGAGMIVGKGDESASSMVSKEYSAFEKDLNALIREHFPEWECKSVESLI